MNFLVTEPSIHVLATVTSYVIVPYMSWHKAIVMSFLFKEFDMFASICSWAADQVVGLPRVYPRYGDIQGSWAQGNKSDDEWIEVSQCWAHLVNRCCL